METQRKNLLQLFIPISLELLCFMLAGMLDTMMLSSVNDAAVGAVGTANTYMNMFIIMFNIISSGMIAVMTQYIGAGKVGIAYQARQLGSIFNAILGVLLSLFLFTFSGSVLRAFGHTKQPLFATLSANVLNLILNAVFLFMLDWASICT